MGQVRGVELMDEQIHPKRITLTKENLHLWPNFQSLHSLGKIVFDKKGRLRYTHGAPVGDLLLVRINEEGKPIYKESAEEWFDPDSPFAKHFKWPE